MEKKAAIKNIDLTSKFLIFMTMLFVAAVGATALYYQDSPIAWFVEVSAFATGLRAALLVLLTVLLFSNPPRSILFRSVLLIGTIIMGGVAAQQVISYSMYFLDIALYVQVGIIFAIEALEFRRSPATQQSAEPKKIPVVAV